MPDRWSLHQLVAARLPVNRRGVPSQEVDRQRIASSTLALLAHLPSCSWWRLVPSEALTCGYRTSRCAVCCRHHHLMLGWLQSKKMKGSFDDPYAGMQTGRFLVDDRRLSRMTCHERAQNEVCWGKVQCYVTVTEQKLTMLRSCCWRCWC